MADFRRKFLELGKNEQVSICKGVGEGAAHHGMTPEQLYELLETGRCDGIEDPVNAYRVEIMEYIDRMRGRITLSCDGNCFAHSAAKVLQCYYNMKESEER